VRESTQTWDKGDRPVRLSVLGILIFALSSLQTRGESYLVELRDGSKLVGELTNQAFPLRSVIGKVELPAKHLDSIEFQADQETATIYCTNGDRLQGALGIDAIGLDTIIGKLKLPLATIRKLSPRIPIDNAGLILHYSFDADEPTSVADLSGGKHPGKPHNVSFSDNGVRGRAVHFPGRDTFIQAGDLGRVEEGTICFWMNPDEVSNSRAVLSSDFARGGYCIRFEEATGGEFSAGELTRYCNAMFTRTLIARNWFHVAFAWDRTEAWGYLDGTQRFQVTHTRPGVPGLNMNLSDFVIGRGYSTEDNRTWKGLVDEFRVFRRRLAPEEIATLCAKEGTRVRTDKESRERRASRDEQAQFVDSQRRPSRGLTTGLALYYDFDSEEDGKMIDRSGKGNHGKIVGAKLVRDGVRGGACSFDGNACIDAGDILNLTDDSRRTVCAWVKAAPITAVSGWSALVSKSPEQSPWPGWGLSVNANSRAAPGISFGYPANLGASSEAAVFDNRWHFVCAIFELDKEATRLLVYVDGEPSDFSEATGPHGSALTVSPLTIGRRTPGGGGGLVGQLDELRIYTRSLAASEIAELYRAREAR